MNKPRYRRMLKINGNLSICPAEVTDVWLCLDRTTGHTYNGTDKDNAIHFDSQSPSGELCIQPIVESSPTLVSSLPSLSGFDFTSIPIFLYTDLDEIPFPLPPGITYFYKTDNGVTATNSSVFNVRLRQAIQKILQDCLSQNLAPAGLRRGLLPLDLNLIALSAEEQDAASTTGSNVITLKYLSGSAVPVLCLWGYNFVTTTKTEEPMIVGGEVNPNLVALVTKLYDLKKE